MAHSKSSDPFGAPAGPDGDGICLELSVYDSDFYDTDADDEEDLTD